MASLLLLLPPPPGGKKRPAKISVREALDHVVKFHKSCRSLQEVTGSDQRRQPYILPVRTSRNSIHDYIVVDATLRVTACIIICIGLPLTLLAICALVSLVRDGQVAPIYVINLLVSDLIQFCCLAVREATPWGLTRPLFSYFIYDIGVAASLGFMVCVALERYLVVACPLWYRFRRTIKFSLVVSFMVWAFSIVLIIVSYFVMDFLGEMILLSISLLLPFPLLIFFLAGTLKALSASISVPPEEKRRIVGVLVLVLLNYTLLFLPTIIWFLAAATRSSGLIFNPNLRLIFIRFSPLVDLVLYVFMKKGAVDKLLACLCRCRMTREQEQGQINTVNDDTTERVSSV
ncbi:G-protein coupled receptor 4-like [Centroberyx affinis]|uniref:G-protein coupled receptor 4-like n=1 Tax=Centroberyx affinis TaxID=166261 RepID=UPI003A5BBC01